MNVHPDRLWVAKISSNILLCVHSTIHLYIQDEVMVSALGTLSLFQLQQNPPEDGVETEFTSRDMRKKTFI